MATLRQYVKSDTIKLMVLLGTLESASAALTFIHPMITEAQFGWISAVIAFTTSITGVFMRVVTTTALSDK